MQGQDAQGRGLFSVMKQRCIFTFKTQQCFPKNSVLSITSRETVSWRMNFSSGTQRKQEKKKKINNVWNSFRSDVSFPLLTSQKVNYSIGLVKLLRCFLQIFIMKGQIRLKYTGVLSLPCSVGGERDCEASPGATASGPAEPLRDLSPVWLALLGSLLSCYLAETLYFLSFL